MTNQNNSGKEYPINDYQSDLVGVLRALFKRKWLIVSGIIVFTLLSLVLSIILPKVYRSEGFFQFSDPTTESMERANTLFSTASGLLESSRLLVFSQLKDLGMLDVLKELEVEADEPQSFFIISIQDFKKYSPSFSNFQEFLRFVKKNNYLDQRQFEYLKAHIKNSSQFSNLTQAIYALSRDDLKDVGQSLQQEKNYIVGVELEMEADQRKTAQRFLTAFGEFIRFRIFYEKLYEYITSHLNEFKVLTGRYDNYILSNNIMLQQLLKKKDKLLALYKKYPGFSNIENRQVIELGSTGERYLSLVAQIIGVESRILDLEQLKKCFEIEKKKSELYCEFLNELKKRLDKHHSSGEQVFNEIEIAEENFFKKKNPDAPETLAIRNSIAIELSRFNMLFYKNLRFISGPSLPETPEWPKKAIFIIFGFFIGSLIFISTALILEFWSKHKQLIQSDK